jgi:hypothetical protein
MSVLLQWKEHEKIGIFFVDVEKNGVFERIVVFQRYEVDRYPVGIAFIQVF